MNTRRNEYFDFLRGVAIIMVIGIHTLPAMTEYDSVPSVLTITVRQLLSCSVPIFLAISGYFIARKDLSTAKSCVAFWRKQIPAVYIPCLIFSLGWFALDLKHGESNVCTALSTLVVCGYSVYYFIALIIQLYVMTPLLLRYNDCGGVIACAVLSAISVLAVTYILYICGETLPLIVYAGSCVVWVIFYMLGIWFSAHSRNYPLWPAWIVTVIGFVAAVIEAKYYLPVHGDGLGIKLSSCVFSAGVIILLMSERVENLFHRNSVTGALVYVGSISFGIYLLHMYVRVFCFNSIEIWAVKWIATLSVTILLIMAAKKILPHRFAEKYLGFR